jgi:hypothetical protein
LQASLTCKKIFSSGTVAVNNSRLFLNLRSRKPFVAGILARSRRSFASSSNEDDIPGELDDPIYNSALLNRGPNQDALNLSWLTPVTCLSLHFS